MVGPYFYLNNEFVRSWKKMRVLPMKELEKIQYCEDIRIKMKKSNVRRRKDARNSRSRNRKKDVKKTDIK